MSPLHSYLSPMTENTCTGQYLYIPTTQLHVRLSIHSSLSYETPVYLLACKIPLDSHRVVATVFLNTRFWPVCGPQILLSESTVLENKKETPVLNQQCIQKSIRSITLLRILLQLMKILHFVAWILIRNRAMFWQSEPEGIRRLHQASTLSP